MQDINRQELLDRYREGPDMLAASVGGLADRELDRPAPDGGWTALHPTAAGPRAR